MYNPLSQLVYACNGSQVRNSWIAGKQVMADHTVTTVNTGNLATRIAAWQQRICKTQVAGSASA